MTPNPRGVEKIFMDSNIFILKNLFMDEKEDAKTQYKIYF